MNDEPAQDGEVLDHLKSYGVIVTAALGILTALSPLFGEDGLLQILPMPAGLAAVGPPFATTISLFLLMAIFISLSGRDRSGIPPTGAVVCGSLGIQGMHPYMGMK